MSPTLLLADDSLTIRRVIELTFADEDIRVVTVPDGREAIDRITADPPDIILADVGMPERDGYEVAAFVKKTARLAHIPVLLLTGAAQPIDDVRARSAGCDGVLVKPFDPQLLIARVRELLDRAGSTRSPLPQRPDDSTSPSSAVPPASGLSTADGDYLDRLDAAFAAMSASPRRADIEESSAPRAESDDRLASTPQRTALPQPGSTVSVEAPASLSDAFSALLAAERGNPSPSATALPSLVLSDATIDEIARRVIARLGDEPMRRAVLDAAERLVQAEIDRIKAAQLRRG